ncbi:TolC family protein [Erysipelotrichia bacterium]
MHRENVFAGSPKTSAVGGKALTTGSIYQYFSPPVLHVLILALLFCLAAVCRTAAAEGEGMIIASEVAVIDGDAASVTNEIKSSTAGDSDEIIPEFDPADLWKNFSEPPVLKTDESGRITLRDVHISDILKIALLRNRQVNAAAQRIDQANGQVLQARSLLGTRMTGNFSQTRVDDVAKSISGGKTIDLGKRDSQAAYVEVTQPLFLSGKDQSTLNSARLGRSIAGSGDFLTRQSILLETTLRWLSWLFAGEAEKVSEKNLELAQAHHDLVKARFQHKQVSQFEVLRAEVRLAQARSDLRKQTNTRELACLDLLRILDLPEDTEVTSGERLKMIKASIDPVRDASEAIELREDLRMKRLEVKIAREAIASARSENQPVVSLFGQTGVQDPSSKSSMGNYERKGYWRAGIVANFTLSDGGMRKGRIKEADSRLALAENALHENIEQAKIEIRKASLNIETAEEVVTSQREALKQAEEALRLAGVRYKNGLFTQVELFDAENAYLLTRLQYLQAIHSYHQAVASYHLATGKLGREILVRAVN